MAQTKTQAEGGKAAAKTASDKAQQKTPEARVGPATKPGKTDAGALPPPRGAPVADRGAEVLSLPGGAARRAKIAKALQRKIGNARLGRMMGVNPSGRRRSKAGMGGSMVPPAAAPSPAAELPTPGEGQTEASAAGGPETQATTIQTATTSATAPMPMAGGARMQAPADTGAETLTETTVEAAAGPEAATETTAPAAGATAMPPGAEASMPGEPIAAESQTESAAAPVPAVPAATSTETTAETAPTAAQAPILEPPSPGARTATQESETLERAKAAGEEQKTDAEKVAKGEAEDEKKATAEGEKAEGEKAKKEAESEKAKQAETQTEGANETSGTQSAGAEAGKQAPAEMAATGGAAAGPLAGSAEGGGAAAPAATGGEPEGGSEQDGAAELEERLAKADPQRAAADEADPADVAAGNIGAEDEETAEAPAEAMEAPTEAAAETAPPEPSEAMTAAEAAGAESAETAPTPETTTPETLAGETATPTATETAPETADTGAPGAMGTAATAPGGEAPAETATESEPASAEGFSGDEPALGGGALAQSEAPDLSEAEKKVALESLGEPSGAASAVGGGGGGGAAVPEPPQPEVPDVSAEKPGAAIARVGSLPPVQIMQSLGGVKSAVGNEAGQERADLAANPPTRERPTGSPKNLFGQPDAEAPADGQTADQVTKTEEGRDQPTPAPEPMPEPPPSPAERVREPTVTGTEGGELSERDMQRMSGAMGSLPARDPGLHATAGPGPKVDLSGNADPAQTDEQRGQVQATVDQTQAEGRRDVAREMGENTRIYPSVKPETLSATVPAGAGGLAGAGGGGAGAAGGGSVDPEALNVIAQKEKGGEIQAAAATAQGDLAAKKAEYGTKVGEEKAQSAKDIAALEAQSSADQAQARAEAQAEVSAKKGEWSQEQETKVREANQEADGEVTQGRRDIQKHQQDADRKAAEEVRKGDAEAERERRKAEDKAAAEKRKGKKKSKGFFGWLASKAKAFFNAIKSAIKAVFELARKAIKKAIELAKKAAMWAIEQARKAIVAAIKLVGKALIAIGDRLLAAFPALRDKFRKFIQDKVDKAVKKVNDYADKLKKGVAAALDLLAAGLNKLIGWLEKGLLAVVDAYAAVVQGAIKFAEKVAQALGAFLVLIKDVAAGPIQWIKNLGAGAVDGIKNHLWKAFKEGVQNWFNTKLEQVLGLGKMVWDLVKSGGLSLAKIGKMAWEGIKAMIPPTLIRILVEKLVSLIVPAAGAVMLIIEGLQAAWGAVQRILAAFQKFFAFLKAVKTGRAGPSFATALAAAAIAVIDFVANWLIAKLAKGAAKIGGKIKGLAKKILGRKKGRAKARKVKAKTKEPTKKPKKEMKKALKDQQGKKGDDKKAKRKQDKEKKKRDRLARAKRELPPKLKRLLKRGVSDIRLKATLAAWRLKYRLKVLRLNKHKIQAANSPTIDIYETFDITPAELLRTVRRIVDDILKSEKTEAESKKLSDRAVDEEGKKVIDAEDTSVAGKVRYIRERNRREKEAGLAKEDRETTVFMTGERGTEISSGTGVKAGGALREQAGLKQAPVGHYLAKSVEKPNVTVVENILKLQHKLSYYGKRGLAKLAQIMRQAASGGILGTKGSLQERARARGAFEGLMIAEGARDPSALMDFAVIADQLEKGRTQGEITNALEKLPLAPKGASSQRAVALREEFYRSDKSLEELDKEVRKRAAGRKGDSSVTAEERAAVQSLRRRLDLLEPVLQRAAEANEFNDKAGLIAFLEKKAKDFVGQA